jgi:hypothetical protein
MPRVFVNLSKIPSNTRREIRSTLLNIHPSDHNHTEKDNNCTICSVIDHKPAYRWFPFILKI